MTTSPRFFEPTFALVEKLHSVGGNGQTMTNMTVTGHHAVNVPSEFSSLILVDGVSDVGISALDLNLMLMNIKSTLIMTFFQFGRKLLG